MWWGRVENPWKVLRGRESVENVIFVIELPWSPGRVIYLLVGLVSELRTSCLKVGALWL